MSSNKIFEAVLKVATEHQRQRPLHDHLDIGSGTGELIGLLRDRCGVASRACDCTADMLKTPDIPLDLIDLNQEKKLGYADETFDLVTATEVIEHLEDYRNLVREIHRVLRPGGLCVLSTPNVLNINSRLRNLWFGFPVLFGPLPVGGRSLGSSAGHITPISYFHLAHAMLEAGYSSVRLGRDRFQRSAVLKMVALYAPIRLFGALARRREVRRYKTIDPDNSGLVKDMNSAGMLLARSIIVSGVK
ncbi:MAG: class I SAM-dependent methyltransferase [Pseudomonadota bacterium]